MLNSDARWPAKSRRRAAISAIAVPIAAIAYTRCFSPVRTSTARRRGRWPDPSLCPGAGSHDFAAATFHFARYTHGALVPGRR